MKEKLIELPGMGKALADPMVKFGFYDPLTQWVCYPIEFDGDDTMRCFIGGSQSRTETLSVTKIEMALEPCYFQLLIAEPLSVLKMLAG